MTSDLLQIQHFTFYISTGNNPKIFLIFLKNGMQPCEAFYSAQPYLELLHAGHVVAEHAVLQHGDGVTLAADLLDLFTRAVAEEEEIGAGTL